jgi:hypothetical protein
MNVKKPIESDEDEGGPTTQLPTAAIQPLKGTKNQVDWAETIRSQVNAEFDRVANALESAARKRSEDNREDIRAMVAILQEKRAEVVANDRAGYFIHDWQELRGQVRDMLIKDPRYLGIKARQSSNKVQAKR